MLFTLVNETMSCQNYQVMPQATLLLSMSILSHVDSLLRWLQCVKAITLTSVKT